MIKDSSRLTEAIAFSSTVQLDLIKEDSDFIRLLTGAFLIFWGLNRHLKMLLQDRQSAAERVVRILTLRVNPTEK